MVVVVWISFTTVIVGNDIEDEKEHKSLFVYVNILFFRLKFLIFIMCRLV